GEPPRIRVHGEMTPVKVPPMDKKEIHAMIYDILNDRQRKIFEETHDIDFSMELGDVARFRVNVFMQHRGEAAVFRTIPSEVISFDKLGLPNSIRNFAKLEKGIVLVTGPTGSGKSTTLAAIIDLINQERHGHILTIEDPIEFVHERKSCLMSQREVGVHSPSFSAALHSALREDPDAILVGELRDLETMGIAMTAAEMGILVMGTLHTNGAAATVDRVVNIFPADKQDHVRNMLSTSLRGVISQQLLKTSDGSGRVAALEILINTPAVANLIRQGKLEQLETVMQSSASEGMCTMDHSLNRLVQRGKITGHEAYLQAMDKSKFEEFKDLD
ncbi:MAG: type IV pilus twitching motility protein PilT, partial [Gammaproteobacteria bacterium]